jgi:hypothetical protein
MVLASKPVASIMRLAARPVGAHRRSPTPLAARMRRMPLTIVVLPTPGPPVRIRTLDISARRIAVRCRAARRRRRAERAPTPTRPGLGDGVEQARLPKMPVAQMRLINEHIGAGQGILDRTLEVSAIVRSGV